MIHVLIVLIESYANTIFRMTSNFVHHFWHKEKEKQEYLESN